MSDSSTREERLGKAAEVFRAIGKPVLDAITFVLPFVVEYSQKGYDIWITLPHNVVQIILGLICCFFGGLYPTLFAAIQAIKVGGFSTLSEAIMDLYEEVMVVLQASQKDDEIDKDKDGKADVNQIDNKALLLRKANIVMTKINPQKVDKALASVYKIWAAVIATLTIQFARTIALAVTIADSVRKPIHKYIEPTLTKAVPKGYERWVPIVIGWFAKSIAISFAWQLQALMSSVSSAIEGGLVCSRALLQLLMGKGINLRGLIKPNSNDTYIDEIFAFILAVSGFYFQFSIGFDIEFPYNIPLMPFELSESYLRWTLTKMEE